MTELWRDRPTLVTGATGLVGSWLTERLLQHGADVVCVVRDEVPQSRFFREQIGSRVKIAWGDICDQAFMERVLAEYEIITVMHLAAQSIVGIANRNPVSTFESNIRGTWSTLEACRRSPCVGQIVVASSDKAYGEQRSLPYTEDHPLEGRHPYDVSKSCADLIAQMYATTFALPVVITRCGNFYGGGDLNFNRVVPGTIRSILRGERPVIRSDGTLIRDYFYVEDGARCYMHLAEHLAANPALAGRAFNFSNESQTTVLAMVRAILDEMGSGLEPDIQSTATHEIPHQYLSAARARAELGWAPAFTLEEGLRRTVGWYRGHVAAEDAAGEYAAGEYAAGEPSGI